MFKERRVTFDTKVKCFNATVKVQIVLQQRNYR